MTGPDFDRGPSGGKNKITPVRIAAWIMVGAFGTYLVVTGILGILAKG